MTNLATKIDNDSVLDIASVRQDFPILSQKPHGKDLHYLDSGASSQKPLCVIESLRSLYSHHYANVHRGTYDFSERTTHLYEESRRVVQKFLNAEHEESIIFTSGTTAGINLVAHSYARAFLQPGDIVLTSEMEHHSNLVPWQLLRDQCGITLHYVPVLDDGSLDMEAFDKMLNEKVKLVALTHVSNVLGTVNPIEEIIAKAHNVGAKILLDGSQAVMHTAIDVQALGVDFYAFTGHKIYAPNAIGVLYGKRDILNAMPPFLGGGDMIKSVQLEKTTYAEAPARFEAGTPPIAEAIGLKTALEYVQNIGLEKINNHEKQVLNIATKRLQDIKGLKIIGEAKGKAPIISFILEGGHPHDIATILDMQGVAVRAGHHCAEPLMHRFGINGTVRASFAMYNDADNVEALANGLQKAQKILGL